MAPPCLVSSLEEFNTGDEDLPDRNTRCNEEPQPKKSRTERMFDFMLEQNDQLKEQEKTLIAQNEAFLSLFGRLVNTIENTT